MLMGNLRYNGHRDAHVERGVWFTRLWLAVQAELSFSLVLVKSFIDLAWHLARQCVHSLLLAWHELSQNWGSRKPPLAIPLVFHNLVYSSIPVLVLNPLASPSIFHVLCIMQ